MCVVSLSGFGGLWAALALFGGWPDAGWSLAHCARRLSAGGMGADLARDVDAACAALDACGGAL